MVKKHYMEWTKENARYTYILVKNKAQKERAIKFYEDLGFIPIKTDLYSESGTIHTEKEGIYADISWNPFNKRKINPFYKPRRKFPREMMVSQDGKNWQRRTVYGKIKTGTPYIAFNMDSKGSYYGWVYAKEID